MFLPKTSKNTEMFLPKTSKNTKMFIIVALKNIPIFASKNESLCLVLHLTK